VGGVALQAGDDTGVEWLSPVALQRSAPLDVQGAQPSRSQARMTPGEPSTEDVEHDHRGRRRPGLGAAGGRIGDRTPPHRLPPTGTGAVNQFLDLFGIKGPAWFTDSRGLLHLAGEAVGMWSIDEPPGGLTDRTTLGLSWWEWIKGPSVALSAIMLQVVWTTAGTFMLMFLAALQDVPTEVDEAAMVDGATKWERFRHVTVPHLRPTLLLVVTLGIIGTWQVFDQMYIMTQGGPAKSTSRPRTCRIRPPSTATSGVRGRPSPSCCSC